jgi:hypothetical protein
VPHLLQDGGPVRSTNGYTAARPVRIQAGPGVGQLGQKKSAPGPCRRGCGDETWSAVIRFYDGHPSADSRGTEEASRFPQLSSQGGIGRGATSSEEGTALPVHRYGGDPR